MRTVEYHDGTVVLIDQTKLPHVLERIVCRTAAEVAQAIKVMQVRGAPAIGVAAAGGLALAACETDAETSGALLVHLDAAAATLAATRPTAVNLRWALDRQLRVARATAQAGPNAIRTALAVEAIAIGDEDVELNQRMGAHGSALLPDFPKRYY